MLEKLAQLLASKTKPMTDAESSEMIARRFPEGARENAGSDVNALDKVGQEGFFYADGKSDGMPAPLRTLVEATRQSRSENFVAVNPHADPDLHKRVGAMVAAAGRSDEFFVLNFDSSCKPAAPKNT